MSFARPSLLVSGLTDLCYIANLIFASCAIQPSPPEGALHRSKPQLGSTQCRLSPSTVENVMCTPPVASLNLTHSATCTWHARRLKNPCHRQGATHRKVRLGHRGLGVSSYMYSNQLLHYWARRLMHVNSLHLRTLIVYDLLMAQTW